MPNKNERHVKFGGQVPPTVIGQSKAVMAAWHDFLGQSSRIYRAFTGVSGAKPGRFPQVRAANCNPQRHPSFALTVDRVGRLLPLFCL